MSFEKRLAKVKEQVKNQVATAFKKADETKKVLPASKIDALIELACKHDENEEIREIQEPNNRKYYVDEYGYAVILIVTDSGLLGEGWNKPALSNNTKFPGEVKMSAEFPLMGAFGSFTTRITVNIAKNLLVENKLINDAFWNKGIMVRGSIWESYKLLEDEGKKEEKNGKMEPIYPSFMKDFMMRVRAVTSYRRFEDIPRSEYTTKYGMRVFQILKIGDIVR